MLHVPRRRLPALLVYTVVALVTTWPLAWSPLTLLGAPVGAGDPFLNLWILGWGLHAVVHAPMSILTGQVFDANIFHPASGTLAYSDHLLLQSVALAPVYALTDDVVLCYNLLLIASLVLSAYAMHVYVRGTVGSEGGAYLAGLAWGFGSYRFAHLLHLQLQALYVLPLAMLYLHRTVAGRRWSDSMVLGALTGVQALSSVYYAVIGSLGLLVSGLAIVLASSRRGRLRVLTRLALAAVIAGGMTFPVGVVYYRVQQEQGFGRSLFEAEQAAARPGSYLHAPAGNLFYGRTGLLRPVSGTPPSESGPERELFPGFVLAGLALIGIWAGWRSDARPLVIGMCCLAVVGAILSFGPDGWRTVYAWLHQSVFGFQAIRAPARFAVLVMFALAVLAALGWRELSASAHGVGRRLPDVIGALIMAAGVAELAHVPTALTDAPARTTTVGRWLRDAPGSGAVVVLPVGIDVTNTPAMVQSLEHRRGLINGYSGQRPEFYPALVDVLSTFPSDESLATLHDRGVQYIVNPRPLPDVSGLPLVLRATTITGASIYELAWTPEVEARIASRETVVPPPPGPIPFRIGDRSEYGVRWEGGLDIEAARVVVTVDGPSYQFAISAATAPWVSRFFDANDRFVTVTDATLIPQTHERDQREGARHVTRGHVYDHDAAVVRIGPTVAAARQPQATTLPLDRDARDAIAALFYVRTLPLAEGAQYQIPINEGGRNVRLDLTVVGRETITVMGVSRSAWRLAPALRERVERRRPPNATLWLSDDEQRLPLAIDVTAVFGRVRLELVAHQDGR